MGITEILKTTKTYIENRNGGPGVTMYIEGKGMGGLGVNAEVYQAPGLMSRPAKGTRGVLLPIGKGRRYAVVIAMHNYDVIVSGNDGDTTLFSTASNGKTVQARVELDNLGKIKVGNATQSLKATMDALSTALTTFCTACAASPDPVLVAAASALSASVAAYRVQLALLLKD